MEFWANDDLKLIINYCKVMTSKLLKSYNLIIWNSLIFKRDNRIKEKRKNNTLIIP
jgi:hypothetical protein